MGGRAALGSASAAQQQALLDAPDAPCVCAASQLPPLLCTAPLGPCTAVCGLQTLRAAEPWPPPSCCCVAVLLQTSKAYAALEQRVAQLESALPKVGGCLLLLVPHLLLLLLFYHSDCPERVSAGRRASWEWVAGPGTPTRACTGGAMCTEIGEGQGWCLPPWPHLQGGGPSPGLFVGAAPQKEEGA